MSNGDLTFTTPINKVVVANFSLVGFGLDLENSKLTVGWKESTTVQHFVTLQDAANTCRGFDITGNVITDEVPRALTGEYSKILGILFGAGASTPNQRKSAAIQALKDDGVITFNGTVG